jgi:thymidylate synthase (FAD)
MTKIKIIKPYFIIENKINGIKILKNLERYGRISHKSEKNITKTSYRNFLNKILSWGHESILEHEKITVRIICDRGVTHELVRHRIAAYTQESTRYCNYSGEIQFIKPYFFPQKSKLYQFWYQTCLNSASAYDQLIKEGSTPEQARSVLPNSLKTEIIVTYNLREWRHVFEMRCQKTAHPQMREIMIPLLKEFKKKLPIIFDDFVIHENKSLSYPLYAIRNNQFWQNK